MRFPFSRTVKIWWRLQTFKNADWKFSNSKLEKYLNGYDSMLRYYLPISVENLTILDEGAGEGETAKFFLDHGARNVICVEPDLSSFRRLVENAKDKPMVCLNKKFELDDLKLDFDFMKMNIEGYEEALLSVQFDKPCVVQVHGLQLRDKFKAAGYTIRNSEEGDLGCLSFAYKEV
jgi:hypothetical protein